MKQNRILSLVLAGALALNLAACGAPSGSTAASGAVSSEGAASSAASSAAAASSEAAEAAYPLTLTDQAGREVTLEAEPETLVSGYYISTSLLIALGLEDQLVGIEAKADSRPIYARSATLAEMGVPALVVNPEDQDLLNEAVTLIGEATNTSDRAAALLDFAAGQEERLAQALEGAETPSVYLAGNSDFLSTAGDAMYQADMIRMAGGVNAAAGITDTYWATVSYEQVLAWDPDYIVLASDASYTVDDVLNDPSLAGCKAVENGSVVQIPGDAEAWDSPVPSGILGSVWLASVLHPEECPAEEAQAVINEFYETFYGFTYSEN